MWRLQWFELTVARVGPQVYRGADGGRARTVGGALTATHSTSTFTSLWAPPLPLLIPPQSVCRYTHRHTDAEWESVDYCGLSEENRAEQEKMGLWKKQNKTLFYWFRAEKPAPCLQLHGNQRRGQRGEVSCDLYTCKRHHWFCLTTCPHTFVSKAEERLGPNPISKRRADDLSFWASAGQDGRTLTTLIWKCTDAWGGTSCL